MKLHEVLDLQAEQLDEGILKKAAAAAALVLGALSPSTPFDSNLQTPVQQVKQHTGADPQLTAQQMIKVASEKYHVQPAVVDEVVRAALKYQDPVFPRAEHLLALVGVESSFNPRAVSKLRTDPAIGLTQIRPKASGIGSAALKTIDGQIQQTSIILKQLYKRFGNIDAALHAYNVGPSNHLKSLRDPKKGNPRYAPKVNAEANRYQNLIK